MKEFKFFNSLSNTKQTFHPLHTPHVALYTCGPTVYNFAHIGNFRTYMFEDILKRSLKYFGYHVKHVMNITDIDDKTLKGAIENNVSLKSYTEPYTKAFLDDLHALSIIPADILPKATDHISEMIEMISSLMKSHHAYKGEDGSVYFSLSSFPTYGRLSKIENKELEVGASRRVSSDEYDKDNPSDFVLWKAYDEARDGMIYWDSPFGKGRPGWHIECSAMATKLLGKTIDIHCGGIDNMFPHHENEIAQCEACHHQLFSQFWLHSQHLLVEGKKMSKSLGNFFTLRDLIAKGYLARQVRFVLAGAHYKMPLNFTFEGLESAKSALARIDSLLDRLKAQNGSSQEKINIEKFKNALEEALLDDLNTPVAYSTLFDLIRFINAELDQKDITNDEALRILDCLKSFDSVFGFIFHEGLKIPAMIIALAESRKEAKKQKNFKEADRLRDEIKSHGYLLEDTPQGYRITNL